MLIARRPSAGFTAIELLIAVVIVGVLASIAYPSYQDQLRKARRGDAKTALMGLAGALERYAVENNSSYVGATVGNAAGSIYPNEAPLDGTTKYYDLAIAASTATTYSITAAPKAGTPQAADQCGTLTVTHLGQKTASGSGNCW